MNTATGVRRAGAVPFGNVLAMLLVADVGFMLLHIAYIVTGTRNHLYSIEMDRSYSEAFQYLKTLWIVFLLGATLVRTRAAVFGAWAVGFGYLALDDMLQIHEEGGRLLWQLSGRTELFGLPMLALGELATLATSGLLIAGTITLFHLRARPEFRPATRQLGLLTIPLIGAGVGVDLLHSIVQTPALQVPLALLEDGGEMLACSFLCWFACVLESRRGHAPASLRQILFPAHAGDCVAAASQAGSELESELSESIAQGR